MRIVFEEISEFEIDSGLESNVKELVLSVSADRSS